MSKRDRHLVVGFICEVLACDGEDVTGHVDGVNPTHMCHRSFGVVRRNKEVYVREARNYFFFCGCCSSSRMINWGASRRRSMLVLSATDKLTFIADLSRKVHMC